MGWAWVAITSIIHPQTISLALIVALILIMSRIMKDAGHMDRLVESFSRLSNDPRMIGSIMAALIGLLPMPGGALFSAPMVETSLAGLSVTSEQKTLINYWFRHIWEYWWPLFPAVVLTITLMEVDSWKYMAVMAPISLISGLAGVLFILRPIQKTERPSEAMISWSGVRSFLWEIMPILIVVLVIMMLAGLSTVLNLMGFPVKVSGAYSILPGLVISLIWVCRINHAPSSMFKGALMDKGLLTLASLIFAIMVFKGVMVEGEAVVQLRNELIGYHIPVLLVIMIMPFLSGLITGIAIGFVGTSFPLIIPLFPADHSFEAISFAAVAFTFGFMGMMLSPIHLCLLVTKERAT